MPTFPELYGSRNGSALPDRMLAAYIAAEEAAMAAEASRMYTAMLAAREDAIVAQVQADADDQVMVTAWIERDSLQG